jgi:hemolysin D
MHPTTPTPSTPSPTGAAPPPKPALLELWAHYRAVFQHAWAHRAELAGPARLADEVAFLPAALSLQDTPLEKAIAGSPEVAV